MENVLEIKDLCKKYDNFELKNININLKKGTIMGLIGENGAGKSTTIKAIADIVKPEKGSISLFGQNNQENLKKLKENIGILLDDSFFSEYLTPNDINAIMKNIYKNWDETLYRQYLSQFKLPTNKIYKNLSSGMKMKLKIATTLSHHPKLLILDEPTTGLDPVARNEIIDLFRDFIQDEECSILLSSHITTDLEHIADYVTFISNGQIILTKTTDELLENYGIVKCSEEDFLKIDKQDYLTYKKNQYDYELLIENKKEFQKKYKNQIIDKPTLETIMLLYIKGVK